MSFIIKIIKLVAIVSFFCLPFRVGCCGSFNFHEAHLSCTSNTVHSYHSVDQNSLSQSILVDWELSQRTFGERITITKTHIDERKKRKLFLKLRILKK